MNHNTEFIEVIKRQSNVIFDTQIVQVAKNTDNLFRTLLPIQYIYGVLIVLTVSPFTWIGAEKLIHLHVWAAVILGLLFISLPLYFIVSRPGDCITKYTITVSQMLIGVLYIHLTGGRIETHFHVFVSLAILSAYRDWRILILASLIVVTDHVLRGIFYPQSIFGVFNSTYWRWLEHSMWVVFEDIFLSWIILKSVSEMREASLREAELEVTKASIEKLVEQRTLELGNKELQLCVALENANLASRFKSEFLANMSHEIRTPMNGVLGLTDLLLETEITEKQREYLVMLQSAGVNLLMVINEILDFSKIESGKVLIEAVPFNLKESMIANLGPFILQAEKKGIALDCQIDSNIPELVIGDVFRVRQILNNLVANALKFTEQGKICIGIELVQQYDVTVELHFWVLDSGIGMSFEQQSLIFKPFTQADSSTTRRYGGTGLGLTIVAKLLELMNATLSVESTLGEGSRFQFTLPFNIFATGDATLDEQHCHEIIAESCERLEILLAEDNKINQRVATIILENLGYAVTLVENGKQVLEIIEKKKFDLILMDMLMPEMDGIEATRAIRELENNSVFNIPIIALTANAMDVDKERCLEAGMDSFISKPFNKVNLQAIIQLVLSSKL